MSSGALSELTVQQVARESCWTGRRKAELAY